jgi:hypothetical protein
MPTGLQYLVTSYEAKAKTLSFDRSLFEGSLSYLMEAPATTDSKEDEDPLADPELQKQMPAAKAATIRSLTSLMNIAMFRGTTLAQAISQMREKVASISDPPKSEAETQIFKDSEIFHALLVKSIDKYAMNLASLVSAKKPTDENVRRAIYQQSLNSAVEEANEQVSAQLKTVPFLKRLFSAMQPAKTASGNINKLVPDFANLFLTTIMKLEPRQIFSLVKSNEFGVNRAVQGKIMSQVPTNVPGADVGTDTADQADKEDAKKFQEVKKRLEDYKTTFKKMYDSKQLKDDEYDIFEMVVEDIEGNKTYEELQKTLGPAQKQFLSGMIKDAGENFEALRAFMKKASRIPATGEPGSSEAGAAGGEGGEPEGAAPTGSSLRQMFFTKDNKKRAKINPEGDRVKTSIMNLVQDPAWKTLTDPSVDPKTTKIPSKSQADLMLRLRTVQDSLRGLKIESKDSQEELIVERWQRLAGLRGCDEN